MGKKYYSLQNDFNKIKHNLENKYFNLFFSNVETPTLKRPERRYLLKKFWSEGKIAAFEIPHMEELGFSDFVEQSWDMYGTPKLIQLVNEYTSNRLLVPQRKLEVGKNVVVGYLQSNQKGLRESVEWYIERIAQVETIIYTNLQFQKMPFVIPVDKTEKTKVEDIVDKILNDELVIYIEGIEPTLFKCIQTNAPYLVDKLTDYKKSLEYDLKTIMGINNPGEAKAEQLQLAEVNAANAEINSYDNDFDYNLTTFSKEIKEVLGFECPIRIKKERARMSGQVHQKDGGQQGPEESEEVEND